jgi:imidazolonepropionase-like amidohydrolase
VVQVGPGLDGDEAVDCAGATVLPGLFDCHVHVMISGVDTLRQLQTPFSYPFYEAVHNLRRTLALGITHVRDAGGADLGVAEAVRRGLVPGPRMQIAVSMLSQTGGHGDGWHVCGAELPLMGPHPGRPDTVVDGPDEVRRKVRELLRAGADVLKVATSGGVLSARDDPRHPHFRPAELDVLVEEARAAGVFVMAHAQGGEGIKNAVRAGIRSIEHGIFLDDEAVDLMLEHGTWLVPTLAAPRAVLAAAAAGAALPEAVVAKARAVQEAHDASVARAVEAGVRIAMGTDSGVGPHGDNLSELGLMAACGLSPDEVWRATTLAAAELMGVDREFGSLEPGKRADVVVLDGDAHDLTGLAGRVREVWRDGELVAAGGRVVDDGIRPR